MIGIDMDMPKTCYECQFGYCFNYDPEDNMCGVNGRQFTNKEANYTGSRKRVDWCPLINLDKKEEPT